MLDIKDMSRLVRDTGEFTWDIETTAPFGAGKKASLDPHRGIIQGVAMKCGSETAWYEFTKGGNASWREFKKHFKPVFEDREITSIGHNLKFDTKWMRKNGMRVHNKLWDTMIASWLCNENRKAKQMEKGKKPTKYGLEKLVEEHFGVKKTTYGEQGTLFGASLGEYAIEDVVWTEALKNHYEPDLEADELLDVFHKIEMPLVPILAEMELTGMKFDPRAGAKHRESVIMAQGRIERRLYEQIGYEINLASGAQVAEILYHEGFHPLKEDGTVDTSQKVRIPVNDEANDRVIPRGKDGYSTKKEALMLFKHEFPFVNDLLEFRHYGVLMNTFIDKLIHMARTNPTGRIHGSFNQTGTRIGRLSSSEPNQQNIPRPDDYSRAHDSIRGCFISEPGNLLVDRDLSQIELRMMAHWSEDPIMMAVYLANGVCPKTCEEFVKKGKCQHVDIHTATAVALDILRQIAKNINFGACYRIGPKKLRTYAGTRTTEEGRRFLQGWYDTYEGVVDFHEWVERELKANAWKVRSITGRLRRLLAASKQNDYKAVTQGIQFIISGSSQDLLKIAMRNMYEAVQERALYEPETWSLVRFICQVHDQVTAEAPKEIAEPLYDLMGHYMDTADSGGLSVPIQSEGSWGRRWTDCH